MPTIPVFENRLIFEVGKIETNLLAFQASGIKYGRIEESDNVATSFAHLSTCLDGLKRCAFQ